jgi:hypothetical protein
LSKGADQWWLKRGNWDETLVNSFWKWSCSVAGSLRDGLGRTSGAARWQGAGEHFGDNGNEFLRLELQKDCWQLMLFSLLF